MAIFDAIAAPALKAVTDLIGQFHLSPEEKAQAQQAIADAQAKAQLAAQDYDVQLNSIAGQNIRAEQQSGDKMEGRARPMFLYIIEAVLAFNYIGVPIGMMLGSKVTPLVLPDNLLWLFGVCLTGYTFCRTGEKISALPGDSQISFLGMKVGNKN